LPIQHKMPAILPCHSSGSKQEGGQTLRTRHKLSYHLRGQQSHATQGKCESRWSRSQMAGLGGTSNPSPPRRRRQATSRVSFGSETYTNVTLLGGKGALLKANASRDVLATGRAQGTSIPSPPQRGTRPSAVSASSLNSLHPRGSKSVLRSPTSTLLWSIKKRGSPLHVCTSLYMAIHLTAVAEQKTQNQTIHQILQSSFTALLLIAPPHSLKGPKLLR